MQPTRLTRGVVSGRGEKALCAEVVSPLAPRPEVRMRVAGDRVLGIDGHSMHRKSSHDLRYAVSLHGAEA